MALDTPYQKNVTKTAAYTMTVEDDQCTFTGATTVDCTLPPASTCRGGQGKKRIINAGSGTITVVITSPNTIVGGVTLAAGAGCEVKSDETSNWFSLITSADGSGTGTSVADSKAVSAALHATSTNTSQSILISSAGSQNTSQSVLLSVATSTANSG